MASPLSGKYSIALTLENEMSTNVVMPHPDDAMLRHDDCLLWPHYECVPEVSNVA